MASDSGVSFRILGPVEISVDGRRLTLPGGHARSILGLLLLQPNRVVPTHDLIDALWREDPPRTAQNVLQAHVATLRRSLRPPGATAGEALGDEGREDTSRDALVARVETHPGGYLLRVEPGELDADLFEAEVADAERLAAGTPGAATDLLRRAVARWRGDVDAGGAESSAAAGAVARLNEQRLAAIESLAELNLQLGRAREVVADLEPLVREHPFRERFHALLMIALYRGGRQADALAAYRSAREVLVDELGVEPGPELRALELAVLRQEPGLLGPPRQLVSTDAAGEGSSTSRPRRDVPAIHNAPSITTSFVGRRDELETVGQLLGTERLVAITGVGGAGKTRFALEVAALVWERFPGGATFVDLTPVPDGERLHLAVAGGLGIAEEADRTVLASIIDGIGDEPRLLIMDNCEHVIEPCARLAEALLVGSPALSILATSREPLRLGSEVLWRLAPLGTAATPALPDGTAPMPDAVRLLLDRAGRARPHRAWSDADLEAIAVICQRLDGLPLAIEMAAARLRVLEPADVLDRLDDRFRLLTDGGRTAIPRQRTLRATLDWSYELLDAADQAVLRRMSAFATAVPPAAVEAVCGEEDVDAVEAVVRLADRSLAFGTVGTDGRSRFGLLDTVREYGRVQLRASGEEAAIAHRHVDYWMTFAAGAFALRDEHRDEQADALEREIGELRLALDRAHAMTGGEELALTGLLGWFWLHHTHLIEGRHLLERALSRPGGGELDRARCLCAAGAMAALQGDGARASERFEAGLAILRRRGAVAEECVALDDRGWGLFFLGDVPGAEAAFERAVLLADRTAVPGLVRRANTGLCQMVVARGHVERARPLARQLMRIAGGDLWTEHLAHHFLADVALMEGAPAEALGWYRTALELAHRMGNAAETGIELQGVAMAAAGVGDPELAIRINGAAEAALERVGFDTHSVAFWASLIRRYIDPARASLGQRVAALDLGGRSLSLDDAVREALERSTAIEVSV